MHNPTKQHFGATKRILRYVARTLNVGSWYRKMPNFRLIGFTDNDWAECLDDWKNIPATFSVLAMEQ